MLLSPDWYTTIPNCANLIYLSADVIFSEKPIDLREEKFVENCGALFIFDFHLTRVFFLMAWVFPLRSSNKSNSVPTFRANNWEQKSTNLARQTRVYIQNGLWWPHNTITQWTWHFISNYWKIGRLNFKLRDIFPKDQELVYTLVDT